MGTTVLVEAGGASVRLRTSEVGVWVVEGTLEEETVEEVDSLTEDSLNDTEDDEEGSLDADEDAVD